MDIILTLTVEEVNAVLFALGQLPTSSGAFPLLAKIKGQGDAQVPPPIAEEVPTEVPTEVVAE